MARLKQWLIMAMRMLVIAGLIFAISRPLSSGWMGSIGGGKPETVIVLLDRSASMQHQQLATGETKLSTGIKKMAATLETVVGKKPLVLIESTLNVASTVDTPAGLLDLPNTTITESQADISAMMQTALDYISDNQAGRTDIWICSDAAKNDWNEQSSRWQSLNSGFSKLEGVRFHVLNFPQPPEENMSVVVDAVNRVTRKDKTELVIDLTVNRSGEDHSPVTVPLTFTINGLRSVMDFSIDGQTNSLLGHRIPIDAEQSVGWGKVELPTDPNRSDNSWYFAFADPVVRKTVIVSEKKSTTRAINLAAATSTQSGIDFESVVLTPDSVSEINWQETSMLVWQAPLPTGTVAKQIERFVESGRTAIFLPPELTDENQFAGIQWTDWQRGSNSRKQQGGGTSVSFWNNDEDLLARTRSGSALPVNDLLVYRHCKIKNSQPDLTPVLAKLGESDPLLIRRRSGSGAMYFLTTWPVATHSSLDREGVTLFAMMHRAIALSAESQGAARQFDAGTLPAREVETFSRLDVAPGDEEDVIANLAQALPFRAGVYGDDEQLIALNRPLAEDQNGAVSVQELESLFEGLDFALIDGEVGSAQSLTSEVWRFFVALMAIALLLEAILSMPSKPEAKVELQPATAGASTTQEKGQVAA